MKKKNFLLTTLAAMMLASALTGCGVEQTGNSITMEAGQELMVDPMDYFNIEEDKVNSFTFDTTDVDTQTVGIYDMKAYYKKEVFPFTVTVVDTTAPSMMFTNRYIFTNDIENADFSKMLEGIYDASEYTTKLIRFEKLGNLEVLDEAALKTLTDAIPLPGREEELKALGTEEVPAEEGIYRAVLEAADVHGNGTYEEVVVIYDTTGARIEDVPDKTITVPKSGMEEEPEIDKSDYIITDNTDGKIDPEDIACEPELADAEKHEWIVHVSYTDRAGNESSADFTILLKEGAEQDDEDNQDTEGDENVSNQNGNITVEEEEPEDENNTSDEKKPQNQNNSSSGDKPQNGSSTSNEEKPQNGNSTSDEEKPQNGNSTSDEEKTQNGSAGAGDNAGNDSTEDNSGSNGNDTTNNSDTSDDNNTANNGTSDNEETANSGDSENSNTADNDTSNEQPSGGSEATDPADADKDGVVTDEENANHISDSEQKVIDAGYGVVVNYGDGDYAVLTHGDGYVDGVHGFDILTNYLASMNLEASRMSGGWIDSNNDWYRCIAYDVHELITEEDEEFWD